MLDFFLYLALAAFFQYIFDFLTNIYYNSDLIVV